MGLILLVVLILLLHGRPAKVGLQPELGLRSQRRPGAARSLILLVLVFAGYVPRGF